MGQNQLLKPCCHPANLHWMAARAKRLWTDIRPSITRNSHFFFSPLNTEANRGPRRIRRTKETEHLDNQRSSAEPPLCASGQPLTKAQVYWVAFLQKQAEPGSLLFLPWPPQLPPNSSPAVTLWLTGPLGESITPA